MTTTLTEVIEQSTVNSKRWFPELHARPDDEVLQHMALGIGGEAGEVLNTFKKGNRGDSLLNVAAVGEEMADVFTYAANIAGLSGFAVPEGWDLPLGPVATSVHRMAADMFSSVARLVMRIFRGHSGKGIHIEIEDTLYRLGILAATLNVDLFAWWERKQAVSETRWG